VRHNKFEQLRCARKEPETLHAVKTVITQRRWQLSSVTKQIECGLALSALLSTTIDMRYHSGQTKFDLFFYHNINVKENVFSERDQEPDTLTRAALSGLLSTMRY